MRVALLATVVSLLSGLLAPGSEASPHPRDAPLDRRPNVVLIVTDDMRTDELEFMPHVRNLLVAEGVTFTHAISPHPV
jgi:hypothetical protein